MFHDIRFRFPFLEDFFLIKHATMRPNYIIVRMEFSDFPNHSILNKSCPTVYARHVTSLPKRKPNILPIGLHVLQYQNILQLTLTNLSTADRRRDCRRQSYLFRILTE